MIMIQLHYSTTITNTTEQITQHDILSSHWNLPTCIRLPFRNAKSTTLGLLSMRLLVSLKSAASFCRNKFSIELNLNWVKHKLNWKWKTHTVEDQAFNIWKKT